MGCYKPRQFALCAETDSCLTVVRPTGGDCAEHGDRVQRSWRGARRLESVRLVRARMGTMSDRRALVFCVYIREHVSSWELVWNPSGPSCHSTRPRSCELWRKVVHSPIQAHMRYPGSLPDSLPKKNKSPAIAIAMGMGCWLDTGRACGPARHMTQVAGLKFVDVRSPTSPTSSTSP